MTVSFSFECDTCGQHGCTRQFQIPTSAGVWDLIKSVASDMRTIHQSKTPKCSGTVNAKMHKHYNA